MKTVHIISHSHWDREWYLPYERHHMLLIELIDNVLELFETDPEFKSYYLDGQTIILDDYLEVRPENEALLRKYIENGKLKIGPFYILQDAFLTSSESNVRNMLIGHQESKKWGSKTAIGYYPDTFGNVGQTPQLMKQLGFDLVAFGRGVKPTGFANESNEGNNFISSYSEMKWKGSDHTEILALLFANWYSNGNEIPANRERAKEFWDQKLDDAEAYASMDHLLMMNGCDHQPLQKDLSEAIRIANELYPEYTFVHSDFPTYMEKMIESVPDNLDTVSGELTSQETEGWYTLTNTASSRVYLKQENYRVAQLLEQIAEPLATIAHDITGKYPHDILDYAWKVFMQNHPHDSICGCSIDEVHEEMMTRFQKAENVGKYVVEEALRSITEAIDTKNEDIKDGIPFVVFNTAGTEKSGAASLTVGLDKIYFAEKFPTQSYHELQDKEKIDGYKVVDAQGNQLEAIIEEIDPAFNYELPKYAFRQPYMARNLKVGVYVENAPSLSWQTFYLVPEAKKEKERPLSTDISLENEYLKLLVEKNGTITVTDKIHGKEYTDFLIFEDQGDIGNEYVYKQPNDEKSILSIDHLVDAVVSTDTVLAKELTLLHKMDIPVSADDRLDEEQRKVVEFRNRKAQRVENKKPLMIETKISLEKNSKQLKFTTKVVNEMKDHRLRVLFQTGLQSDTHYADTVFETVKRPNKVSEAWTNPENAQRMHRFVNVRDENSGVVIGPEGLNEYEVVEEKDQQTIAMTLFRAVGEMGDWGYFPTPGAQCLEREFTFTYHLSFHGSDDADTVLKEMIHRPIPLTSFQTDKHEGAVASSGQYLCVEGKGVALTALKRNRESNEPVTRFYNFTENETNYQLDLKGHTPIKSSILEEEEIQEESKTAHPFEIITHKWKKNEGGQ